LAEGQSFIEKIETAFVRLFMKKSSFFRFYREKLKENPINEWHPGRVLPETKTEMSEACGV